MAVLCRGHSDLSAGNEMHAHLYSLAVVGMLAFDFLITLRDFAGSTALLSDCSCPAKGSAELGGLRYNAARL